MGVKWSRSNVDAQMRALASAEKELKPMIRKEIESIRPAVQAAMEFNSDMHKNRITGDMVDAMDTEVSGTGMQLRFGFIKNFKDYFNWQTISGFTHWSSGKFIAPSLAIQDAKLDAEELFTEAMQRVRRNFMARLRRR